MQVISAPLLTSLNFSSKTRWQPYFDMSSRLRRLILEDVVMDDPEKWAWSQIAAVTSFVLRPMGPNGPANEFLFLKDVISHLTDLKRLDLRFLEMGLEPILQAMTVLSRWAFCLSTWCLFTICIQTSKLYLWEISHVTYNSLSVVRQFSASINVAPILIRSQNYICICAQDVCTKNNQPNTSSLRQAQVGTKIDHFKSVKANAFIAIFDLLLLCKVPDQLSCFSY